jgi:cytochrome c553
LRYAVHPGAGTLARALGQALFLAGLGPIGVTQAQGQAATTQGAPAPAVPASAAERFAVCLACHGPGGVSQQPLTPSLAGQHSFYAITQLFLFREGRRSNEAMTAAAKGMSNADMRAFSELIAKLPPPPTTTAALDAAQMAKGASLATRYRCASCHGDDYAGGQQVPRLAGQREDYLLKALSEFQAGTRIGYTSAMSEALAGVTPLDVAVLASYLAAFPAKAP